MVRAKFRCMEISQFWNGQCTVVRFLPVMAKCERFPDEPDTSEENAAFWDATPSGSAKLQLPSLDPVPYELGQCYYLDMEPSDEGEWKMRTRAHHEHQLDIRLERSWYDEVEMQICNEGAWDAFGGRPGESWSVVFTHAGS